MPSKTQDALLTLNSGSSSVKFSLFSIENTSSSVASISPLLLYSGHILNIGEVAELQIRDAKGRKIQQELITAKNHKQALERVLQWLKQKALSYRLIGVGHRIVHGGVRLRAPVLIVNDVLDYLETLIPLAPNHQTANLQGIKLLMQMQPDLPQVACFDTSFHTTRANVEQRFALPPTRLLDAVRRYGFHGLSYEYIAQVLPDYLGKVTADGKVIVAHLGHGASLCAMENRRSVATTMTFTPLDGIPMGTRSGSIDPAVVLYLQQQGMTIQQVSDLLYFQSGLLGVSGISGDVETLLKQTTPEAIFAIDLFVHHTVRAIGSLVAVLGGLDALIFTGGIGEHASNIRLAICDAFGWLGLKLDIDANKQGKSCITDGKSQIQVWVIPTNEERMIAQHSWQILQ